MSIAIGAAIAVMTGIGAGLGTASNREILGSHCASAGGLRPDQQKPDPRLCTGRGNRHLRFSDRYPAYFHELIGVRSNDPQSKFADYLGVC